MKYLILFILVSLAGGDDKTSVACMDRVLKDIDAIPRLGVKDLLKKKYGNRYLIYYRVHLEVYYPFVKDSCTTTLPAPPAEIIEYCPL